MINTDTLVLSLFTKIGLQILLQFIILYISESGIIADISLGSDEADGNHWQVERSNSSITSVSLDSSLSPTSPSEENKGNILDTQTKEQELSGLRSPDSGVGQEELSVKL